MPAERSCKGKGLSSSMHQKFNPATVTRGRRRRPASGPGARGRRPGAPELRKEKGGLIL